MQAPKLLWLASCIALPLQAADAPPARPAPAPPATAVDAELLEFLGSLDDAEEGWQDYLEQRPVRAAAGKPAGASGQQGARPDPKQVKQK